MLTFLGIGAQKAGTTWLYAQLVRHPQIGFPQGKELHFWNRPGTRSLSDYLGGFTDPSRCEGEFTPAYAILPVETIRQIHAALPKLRLLLVIRNPVERAWSSALMALQRAGMQLDEASDQWFVDHFRSAGSLARGDYAMCIQRWRECFAAEQLLVVRYEDILARPREVLQRCCRHLGVTPPTPEMLAHCDDVVFAGLGHPLPERLRAVLTRIYRPRIGALGTLLGEDFSSWCPPPSGAPVGSSRSWLERLRGRRHEWQASKVLERSALFDPTWYLERYPDVRKAGLDPVHHFLRHGAAEGRDPGPEFGTAAYLAANPDVAAAGANALLHYLTFGRAEGRTLPSATPALRCAPPHAADASAQRTGHAPLSPAIPTGSLEPPDFPAPGTSAKRDELSAAPASAGRQRAPQVKAGSKPDADASAQSEAQRQKRLLVTDFSSYERSAMFLRELRAPWTDETRCVLGHMAGVRRHLSQKYAQTPERELTSLIMLAGHDLPALRRAIRSVLAQRRQSFELIVVGLGEQDDIASVVREAGDSRIMYVAASASGTRAARLNAGLARMSGDFVGYVDPGTVLEPDFLRVLAGTLSARPEVDFVYSAQQSCTEDASAQAKCESVRYEVFARALMENRPSFELGAILHRRALLEQVGRFNEGLDRLADWDFLLRASRERAPLGVACILSSSFRHATLGPKAQWDERTLAEYTELESARPPLRGLRSSDLERFPGLYALGRQGRAQRPATMRRVSIIIPSFECLDHLRLCVDSVQAFTEVPYELIVVDNASSAPVREYLAQLAADGHARVMQNEHNLGFSFAVNQGIECADPSADVILLNNDALVTPGWDIAMQRVLHDVSDVGLVVPRQVLPAGTATIQTHNPGLDPAVEAEVNLSLHHDNVLDPLFDPVRGYVELSFAPFFCVYVPRSTLDAIGLLDHEGAPHYWSDRLYCEAVRRIANRRIIYTPDAKLYHFLQRATSVLSQSDPGMYRDMFEQNHWAKVAARATRGPAS